MKDKQYPNPTILLLARESKTFYDTLKLFKNSMDVTEKRNKLQSIEYLENEQEDFIANANVIKHKRYYWTYYEKMCPVHCIFLDKLRELFERG